MNRFWTILYRAAVVALLGYCAWQLNDLDRRVPSTYLIEQQLRALITAVDRLQR